MSIAAADVIESELPRVMHDVTLAILGETGELGPGYDTVQERLSCAVGIHGGFEGEVVVTATFGLAALFAMRMFEGDLSGPPSERDAFDALREVSNIVAGNLKPLLGEHNTLGLPEELPTNAIRTNKGQLAEASSHLPAGVLEVRVFAAL
jgi:CheY-specific phosphatase CheX